MGVLSVAVVGLRSLAAECESAASALAVRSPSPFGPSGQATSAAVADVDAGITVVADALAARVRDVAAAVNATASAYEEQDYRSSRRLTVAGPEVVV